MSCRVHAKYRVLEILCKGLWDCGIVIVPFEFGNDHHRGIEGDLDHWIGGQVNEGHPIKVKPEGGKG